MSTTSSDAAAMQGGRRRARKACVQCRKRKRKCDGLNPCLMCSRYEYECHYFENETTQDMPSRVGDKPAASISSNAPSSVTGGSASDQQRRDSDNSRSRPASFDARRDKVNQKGITDPIKGGFWNQSSVVAFPKHLGKHVESANPPRLHSFAWNCGIRPEPLATLRTPLKQIISYDDCRRYSDVFFATANDVYGFVEAAEYKGIAEDVWEQARPIPSHEALVAAVVALGSLYSFHDGHPLEAQIANHAKSILEDPTVMIRPSVNQVVAWLVRALYLRSTTRPHLAWLASCTIVHLVEALGLHQEDAGADPQVERKKASVFWMAWSLNRVLCYEYGRTSVNLSATTREPRVEGDDTQSKLTRIVLAIPDDSQDPGVLGPRLQNGIAELHAMDCSTDYPAVFRADVCFCFYRRLRLLATTMMPDRTIVASILDIGRAAIEVLSSYAERGIPWFNLLSTTFQYFCVLLSIDTPESLAEVHTVLEKLQRFVKILDTHMAREALETAKLLLRDAAAKKRKESAILEQAENACTPTSSTSVPSIDWDALLDPFYVGDTHAAFFDMQGYTY